ncbi:MAG TPA: hypothetical protein PLJ12_04585 [Planctomycetota bacterium]|nr:hypothetical protein [Planctomycetota bacterium]
MPRTISEPRRFAFYLGRGLGLVGFLLFASVFVTGCMNFGNFDHFEADVKSSMFRALTGVGLIVVGGILSQVGRLGAAGSGLLLDPQRVRRDLEPLMRQGADMLEDLAGDVASDVGPRAETKTTTNVTTKIMVRCGHCSALNPEAATACNECGAPL